MIKKPVEFEKDLPFFEKYYQRYEEDLIWHISTIGTLLVSAYLSTQESSSYDALASENDSLKTQAASASGSEYTSLNTQFEVNQAKMERVFSKQIFQRENWTMLIFWQQSSIR